MLEVRNLTVSYRNCPAIRNISFCLQPGQVNVLLGPNGAGKSTLVKAMLGLVRTDRGVVTWRGQPLVRQLRRVAYVPQRSLIDWDYPVTVWQVVMMGRTQHTGWLRSPSRQSRTVAREALERVGMGSYRRRQIGELSGGQQQRTFLARAIAQQADLLFFDEPFAGIDKTTEAIIFEIFNELKAQGKTLLVISHDLGESLDAYDQFLLLNQELIAVGSKTQVLTSENLARAYGKVVTLARPYLPSAS